MQRIGGGYGVGLNSEKRGENRVEEIGGQRKNRMKRSRLLKEGVLKSPLSRSFLAFLSAVCVAFSWMAEGWMGLKPCHLCLVQRYLHIGVLVLAGVGCAFPDQRLFRQLLVLIFAVGSGIALYQSATSFGFLPMKCTIGAEHWKGVLGFRERVGHPLNCNKDMLKIMGVPASVCNGLMNLGCLFLLLCNRKLNFRITKRSGAIKR